MPPMPEFMGRDNTSPAQTAPLAAGLRPAHEPFLWASAFARQDRAALPQRCPGSVQPPPRLAGAPPAPADRARYGTGEDAERVGLGKPRQFSVSGPGPGHRSPGPGAPAGLSAGHCQSLHLRGILYATTERYDSAIANFEACRRQRAALHDWQGVAGAPNDIGEAQATRDATKPRRPTGGLFAPGATLRHPRAHCPGPGQLGQRLSSNGAIRPDFELPGPVPARTQPPACPKRPTTTCRATGSWGKFTSSWVPRFRALELPAGHIPRARVRELVRRGAGPAGAGPGAHHQSGGCFSGGQLGLS